MFLLWAQAFGADENSYNCLCHKFRAICPRQNIPIVPLTTVATNKLFCSSSKVKPNVTI